MEMRRLSPGNSVDCLRKGQTYLEKALEIRDSSNEMCIACEGRCLSKKLNARK